ncbi:secreted protein containing DUF1552 [Rhodopirellula maiorica SM1]|uniref:Secreted protein containing DUF1552 n=1 Tax=Rhodopirellula maiorica SM1 TaxID=1265738 RepID=M5RID6_9BACT|nr:DUF1552 domain-containing protein [Rhodopirellula maiorica]EMI18951.1 secreted protein containing DUF1552 [Rhodopirellula maiorica SM1]
MSNFHRRQLLRAAGVSVCLPIFSSMRVSGKEASEQSTGPKQRMVCIGNMLGFHPEAYWPTATNAKSGDGLTIHRDFSLGRSTAPLKAISDRMTMISGLDHDTAGGHFSVHSFLSGVRQIDAKTMPDANVTIDQYAAETIAGQTRFPSLTVGSESGIHGGCQLSWTRTGTRVPPITGPEQLFQVLFVGNSEKDKVAAADRFKLQGSILDLVRGDAHRFGRTLNQQDRNKLDEYLTSVRDVEKRIGLRRNWIDVPKPEPPLDRPKNRNMVEDLPLLYDLIALAMQTDSTRIATLEIGGDFNPRDLGVDGDYHALSHHGQLTERIEALVKLETYQIEQFVRFVEKLSATNEGDHRLLEQTSVLFGSGMGNANSHHNKNLPVILAGGDFKHGRLLAFDQDSVHRPPLTNLFVSMLQKFGVETDRFATSTGTLRGLA